MGRMGHLKMAPCSHQNRWDLHMEVQNIPWFYGCSYDGIYKYWSIYGYHYFMQKMDFKIYEYHFYGCSSLPTFMVFINIENIDPWPMRKNGQTCGPWFCSLILWFKPQWYVNVGLVCSSGCLCESLIILPSGNLRVRYWTWSFYSWLSH